MSPDTSRAHRHCRELIGVARFRDTGGLGLNQSCSSEDFHNGLRCADLHRDVDSPKVSCQESNVLNAEFLEPGAARAQGIRPIA